MNIVKPPPFHAFTVKAQGGRLRELVTPAHVFPAHSIIRYFHVTPTEITIQAIWDTGATNTVISRNLVGQLGLIPTGINTAHDANNSYQTSTYLVDIGLPNGILISDVQVTEAANLGNYDLLIGMDIITLGDFAVTNGVSNTWFSFRIPPDGIQIDYVAKADAIQKKQVRRHQNKLKKKKR